MQMLMTLLANYWPQALAALLGGAVLAGGVRLLYRWAASDALMGMLSRQLKGDKERGLRWSRTVSGGKRGALWDVGEKVALYLFLRAWAHLDGALSDDGPEAGVLAKRMFEALRASGSTDRLSYVVTKQPTRAYLLSHPRPSPTDTATHAQAVATADALTAERLAQ